MHEDLGFQKTRDLFHYHCCFAPSFPGQPWCALPELLACRRCPGQFLLVNFYSTHLLVVIACSLNDIKLRRLIYMCDSAHTIMSLLLYTYTLRRFSCPLTEIAKEPGQSPAGLRYAMLQLFGLFKSMGF